MKYLIILSIYLISSLALSSEVSINCTLVLANGDNLPFVKVAGDSTDSNSDLHSIEKKVLKKVNFLLKEGHGILRLEAYRNNKFVASTLVQKSHLTKETMMNLRIIDIKNKDIETFCYNSVDL